MEEAEKPMGNNTPVVNSDITEAGKKRKKLDGTPEKSPISKKTRLEDLEDINGALNIEEMELVNLENRQTSQHADLGYARGGTTTPTEKDEGARGSTGGWLGGPIGEDGVGPVGRRQKGQGSHSGLMRGNAVSDTLQTVRVGSAGTNRAGMGAGQGWLGRVGSALGVVDREEDRDRLRTVSLSRIQRGLSGLLTPVDPYPAVGSLQTLLNELQDPPRPWDLPQSCPPRPALSTDDRGTTGLRRASSLGELGGVKGQGSRGRWVSPCESEVLSCGQQSQTQVPSCSNLGMSRSRSEPLLVVVNPGYRSDSSVDMGTESVAPPVCGPHMVYGPEALLNYGGYVKLEREREAGDLYVGQVKAQQRLETKRRLISQAMDTARAYYCGPFKDVPAEWRDRLDEGRPGGDKHEFPTYVKVQLEQLVEYRPYATFIYILVQALALLVMCSTHGVARVSFLRSPTTAPGVSTLRGREAVTRWTDPNPWVGPPPSALIRSGALFAPCLRPDITIAARLSNASGRPDRRLGCCQMALGDTSATSTRHECDVLTDGIGEWLADLPCSWRPPSAINGTQVARPCCVGLVGECEMVTEFHCDYLGGIYHAEGPEHCSQVDCVHRLCGVDPPAPPTPDSLPISNQTLPTPDVTSPAQQWRLLTGVVLPPGVFVFVPQVALLAVVGRRVEAGAGAPRMTLIYLVSGIGGLTLGAAMTPLVPHSGAQGPVGGLLGVVSVELLHCLPLLTRPWWEVGKLVLLGGSMLLLGTLPYVDNWELLGGYVTGGLAAVSLLPYISFGRWQVVRRRLLLALTLLGLVVVTSPVLYMLYSVQTLAAACAPCVGFTCLSYSRGLCDLLNL